ncbi:Retrotransposon gag domain [Arabidopsis thaliana x Arabidopsis arenosa]|uniref:Retrotransposon gag domain n=1 Tax=Arabidopsis thaliana x Arabidopsis arenosa TaxID=1240361 RepID=A0A8T2BZM2_9BRAS|nr:Retrotransposon gag domain [Arabidopsis thaliana x Arabidopsis arenosa]
MHLRSHGQEHLVERVEDIGRFERENSRARRERERIEHLERLRMDQQPPPVVDGDHGHNGNDQHNGAQVPNHAPRALHPIGAFDAPNIHGNRNGIRAPPVENNNFEIKSSLINMVQGSKFHGLSMEDPLDHLDQFDMLCSTVKINGISEDAFKLRLFPFSLGDRARIWEKNLPQGSITSWDQCKRAFLKKFFSTTRTARLRNEISSFTQKNNESFCEAWERFKGYKIQCPHHGFSNESLLSTLYRGVLPKFRMLLDTASNGNFLGQDVEDGMSLVENLAQSDGNYGEDYDRTSRERNEMSDLNRKEIKALNDKIDKMILTNQKPVHFISESDVYQGYQENMEGCLEGQEEVNYVGGQGYNKFNPNYRNHPNLSYRSTNVENPQDQSYPPLKPPGFTQQPNYQPKPQGNYQPKPQAYHQHQNQGSSSNPLPQADDTNALLRQLLDGQGRGAIELATQMKGMHTKVDDMYGELNAKIERLNAHVYSQSSSTSKRPMGTLPGKPEPNPKEFCNAIFINDLDMVESYKQSREDGRLDENEKAIEEISKLLYGPNVENIVVDSDAKIKNSTNGNDVVTKRVEKKDASRVESSPYEPPLPFPERVLTKARKKVLSSFKANMSRVGAPLPCVENLSQVPLHFKFIQAILANREKVEEIMGVFDSPSATQPEPKSILKLGDPGKFTIPCSLGDLHLDDALCDSGASVNVMSLEMVKTLGVQDMKHHSSSIMFGDASSKSPLGLIEDYPLKVGDCIVPTDFMVVEMKETHKLPLILGTPFLNTVGASIDFPNKRVTLLHVNAKVSYPIKPSSTKFCGTITNEEVKTKEEPKHLKDNHKEIKVMNVKNREALIVDEKILDGECLHILFDEHDGSAKEEELGNAKKALEKNKRTMKTTHPPTFDSSPSPTSSMTLTPLRYSDGMVEYKVKFKGRSNPFSLVKAILTPEFKEKGSKGVEKLMKEVLTLAFKDPPWSSTTPPLNPLPKIRD